MWHFFSTTLNVELLDLFDISLYFDSQQKTWDDYNNELCLTWKKLTFAFFTCLTLYHCLTTWISKNYQHMRTRRRLFGYFGSFLPYRWIMRWTVYPSKTANRIQNSLSLEIQNIQSISKCMSKLKPAINFQMWFVLFFFYFLVSVFRYRQNEKSLCNS